MAELRSLALSCAALLVALIGHPGTARADEPTSGPLRWDPAWTHANAWDYSAAGVGATALVVQTILLQSRQAPARFYGPILFDKSARELFRASSPVSRNDAAEVSWMFWALDFTYPLTTDVPYAWARYGRGVAWDLFWEDAVVLTVASAVDMGLRDVIGRVRPNDSDCMATGRTDCLSPEAVRSFPSGHFVEATTGASLICTQHLQLKLYGAPWDAVTCATAIASAATVGVLRIVADDHWTSDILGSAALGVLFGWGIPYLMHLHGAHAPPAGGGLMIMPTPIVVSQGAGIGITGIVF